VHGAGGAQRSAHASARRGAYALCATNSALWGHRKSQPGVFRAGGGRVCSASRAIGTHSRAVCTRAKSRVRVPCTHTDARARATHIHIHIRNVARERGRRANADFARNWECTALVHSTAKHFMRTKRARVSGTRPEPATRPRAHVNWDHTCGACHGRGVKATFHSTGAPCARRGRGISPRRQMQLRIPFSKCRHPNQTIRRAASLLLRRRIAPVTLVRR